MTAKGKTKLRAWESDELHALMQHVLHNKQIIYSKCIELGCLPEDLKPLLVEASFLFEVLVAFDTMFNTLVDYGLLLDGYHKQQHTIH